MWEEICSNNANSSRMISTRRTNRNRYKYRITHLVRQGRSNLIEVSQLDEQTGIKTPGKGEASISCQLSEVEVRVLYDITTTRDREVQKCLDGHVDGVYNKHCIFILGSFRRCRVWSQKISWSWGHTCTRRTRRTYVVLITRVHDHRVNNSSRSDLYIKIFINYTYGFD